MTTTQGIEAVFLETHNWGKAARFFQALGFDLEFETDHSSGQLRNKATTAGDVRDHIASSKIDHGPPW